MKKTTFAPFVILAAVAILLATSIPFKSEPVEYAPLATAELTKTYYVSNTGNDGNAGSISAPYKTIGKAFNVAKAGDIIYVRAGSYPLVNVSSSFVSLIGYPGEMPKLAGVKCYKQNNILISGFEVTGAAGGGYTGAINLDQCNNSTVSHNHVHHNQTATTSGIVVSGLENKIIYNDVHDNAYVGIRLRGAASNNEIAYNEVHDHTIGGGDADGIELAFSTVSNTHVHDNVLYQNADDGLDTWTSPFNLIVNNISYNNGGVGDGNGFKLGGGAAGGQNTVTGNVAYGNETSGFTSNGSGNTYQGNVSHSNGECGFIDSWRTGNSIKSSFINNTAYGNIKNNFCINKSFLLTYTGNVESAAGITPTWTPTLRPVTSTPTATPRPSVTWTPFITPMVCETTESYVICKK